MPRKGRRRGRRQNGMYLTLYTMSEITEGQAKDVTAAMIPAFPPAMPFRIVSLHWQIASSGSAAESNGAILHRAMSCQIQCYSPYEPTADHVTWTSAPILIPWGQRIQGSRRINGNWYSSSDNQQRLYRLEVLCLSKDTATVQVGFVISVKFQFRAPDYTAKCPTLRHIRDHDPDDKSDDVSSLEISSCYSLGNFKGGEGFGDA